jgi:uncharacterized DUF497 family protein
VDYDFEWDPNKARLNRRKHGVTFEQAATVFRDQRAVTVFDDAHSGKEDRWITMGLSAAGGLLVVHHTFEETDGNAVRIRVFSSRKATRKEAGQYED